MGSVYGDKVIAIQNPKRFKLFASLEQSKIFRKDVFDLCRVTGVNSVPQLGIARNVRYPEQRAEIVLLDRILQSFLKLKQGGVLKKHHGKGAHQAIMDIVNPGSMAGVRALGKVLGKDFTKAGKADVLFTMQVATPTSGIRSD